ncbi:MAG: tripartite tricarboxylate transporter TctB family protein [Dehalococcoidia bacterium]
MTRGIGILFTLVIALIFASALFVARGWVLEASLFPIVIIAPALILVLILLVRELRGGAKKREGAPSEEGVSLTPSQERWRTANIGAWILGFFLAIWMIGLAWWTVLLFMFLYLKLQSRDGWLLSLILSGVAVAFFEVLFNWKLHLPLTEGQILIWLGLRQDDYTLLSLSRQILIWLGLR